MKTTILVLLGIITLSHGQTFVITKDELRFSKIVNPNNYDRFVSPAVSNNETVVNVQVGMFVQRMRNFDEKNNEFQIDLFLRQKWTDKRLAHGSSKPYKFPEEALKMIWVPDTFLVWDYLGKVSPLIVPNTMVKISSDGNVLYSTKLSTNIPCKNNTGSLECELKLQSYAFNMDEIDYSWKTENKEQVPWPINGFKLIGIERTEEISNYITAGSYKTLKAIFKVERAH